MWRAKSVWTFALLAPVTLAQQSPSYTLEEHVINAGGHPQFGGNPASASHRVTLGSIGESFATRRATGATQTLDSGFLPTYSPPSEIRNLRFTNHVTLVWDAHSAAGRYNVYRDTLASLSTLGYGACAQRNLLVPTTTDALPLAAGSGFFFLVTVENRLFEEGTKGFTSAGIERTGTVCP
jgi:hypothetical protein